MQTAARPRRRAPGRMMRPRCEREPSVAARARPRRGAARASSRARFGPRARLDEPMSRHTSLSHRRAGRRVGARSRARRSSRTSRRPRTRDGAGLRARQRHEHPRLRPRHSRRRRPPRPPASPSSSGRRAASEAEVRAGAARAVQEARRRRGPPGFAGLEFGEGIPGSLGGGLTMNAGAFGGEIGRVVRGARRRPPRRPHRGRSRATLRVRSTAGSICRRASSSPRCACVSAAATAAAIGERVATARGKRKKQQPLGLPNAGSIFKNPPGTFAGSGARGGRAQGPHRGGAQVSERHANFIVNKGGATRG